MTDNKLKLKEILNDALFCDLTFVPISLHRNDKGAEWKLLHSAPSYSEMPH